MYRAGEFGGFDLWKCSRSLPSRLRHAYFLYTLHTARNRTFARNTKSLTPSIFFFIQPPCLLSITCSFEERFESGSRLAAQTRDHFTRGGQIKRRVGCRRVSKETGNRAKNPLKPWRNGRRVQRASWPIFSPLGDSIIFRGWPLSEPRGNYTPASVHTGIQRGFNYVFRWAAAPCPSQPQRFLFGLIKKLRVTLGSPSALVERRQEFAFHLENRGPVDIKGSAV